MSGDKSVLLVGAGSMGGALLRGWMKHKLLDPVTSAVVDPAMDQKLVDEAEAYGITLNPVADTAYDICIIAVKPQLFPVVVPAFDWPDIQKTLFISVAAGKSLASTRLHLNEAGVADATIIRVMPNLPASIGRGISLLYAEDPVSTACRDVASELMSAVGKILWVVQEDQIDSGMSLSGCGPAYVFLLVEAMEEAGVAAGLPQDVAAILARETIIGAGALMDHDLRAPAEMRAAVTSKGGTTAEALSVLDDPAAMRPLLVQAVAAATRRARELSD